MALYSSQATCAWGIKGLVLLVKKKKKKTEKEKLHKSRGQWAWSFNFRFQWGSDFGTPHFGNGLSSWLTLEMEKLSRRRWRPVYNYAKFAGWLCRRGRPLQLMSVTPTLNFFFPSEPILPTHNHFWNWEWALIYGIAPTIMYLQEHLDLNSTTNGHGPAWILLWKKVTPPSR